MDEDLREEEGEQRRREGTQTQTEGIRDREGEEWKSLSRVSNLPLVNTALRAYEQSKASSRVVKVRPFLLLAIDTNRLTDQIAIYIPNATDAV